jgi:hypothetical protein
VRTNEIAESIESIIRFNRIPSKKNGDSHETDRNDLGGGVCRCWPRGR